MKLSLILFFTFILIVKMNAQQQISNFTYEISTQSEPRGLIEFDNRIFFNAASDGLGREVWATDGTTSNTALIKDINPGTGSGNVHPFHFCSAILNDELYFIGSDGSTAGEIWKTDGTNTGTVQITNFLDGSVTQLTAAGNFIFFLIKTDYTLQVWKTDGTTAGTVLVKDELSIWGNPSFQGKCNDNFIFTFRPYGSNDSRVWRSDGTSDGTFPITDEIDGNGSGKGGTSGLSQYIEYNNKLYFVSRYYLHETDGTLENTQIVSAVWNAQTNLVEYSDVIEANNKLYFQFFSADTHHLSIWESDGTSANTNEIYTDYSNQYFFPSNLSKTNEALIFCSSSQGGGTILNSMNLADYTTTSLSELTDSSQEPFIFISWEDVCQIYKIDNDLLYISSVQDNSYARKGWISDITANTTSPVSALDSVNYAMSYNQTLYYSKNYQLWKYTNPVNTERIEAESHVSIYPNPSSQFIKINGDFDIESVCISDLSGRLILDIPKYTTPEIDISELNQGIYLVQIQSNGASITKRIVKY